LTVRLSVASQTLSLDDDGPEVGSSVPADVASVLSDLEVDRGYLLLISAGCTPCRELVVDLGERSFEQKILALVPGREEQASELAALLPSGIRVMLDPEATELAESLELESTPFAIEVEGGTVTRKTYLHQGASDLIAFVESGAAAVEKKNFVEITEKEAIEGR
ncbi:MAG: hypothetical protein M3151_05430, partial [Actinomycetota bacterium]|nr:hypothetical protein [Actinomycetota bacterium]